MSASGITRRELVRRGGLLALPALLAGSRGRGRALRGHRRAAAAAALPGLRIGPEIYQSIGVRPFVNARGTYTILTGSTMLPEARAAMGEASKHYVHLDELAEAIGERLAELTQAEWGMVTHGCSAALTHATAACVTGGNPDLHVRVPDLRGFPRDECIIPKHSRNVYDAAVRAVGVRVVEVATAEELEAAFGPRTALVYILAGPNADEGPLSTKAICEAAKKRGVPVLVDCAAEILTVPNVHLQLGADLVTYSGGKCLRGPQAAGLLLGRKDLVKAAWVGSAPHHGFARGFKVGKEEAMAMLAAVEAWTKRDYEAEIRVWASWVDTIARRIAADRRRAPRRSRRAEGLSNRMPVLQIRWDKAKLGTTGEAVAKLLFESEPRISLFPARGKAEAERDGPHDRPVHDGAGRREGRGGAALRRALEAAAGRGEAARPRPRPTSPAPGTCGSSTRPASRPTGCTCGSAATTSTAPTRATSCPATCGARSTATPSGSAAPGSTATRSTTRSRARSRGDEMAGDVSLGEYLDARFTAKRHASGRA